MKRLFVTIMVLFVSISFLACGQKKDSKTRLQRGAGRANQLAVTNPSQINGWNMLDSVRAEEVALNSQNPDAVARAFLGEGDYGTFTINSVTMKIRFIGNQVDTKNSRIGFRFYDDRDYSNPIGYFVGPESGDSAQGSVSGNKIVVVFNDGGTIRVDGTVSSGNFSGTITYDNGQFLGNFSVPVEYSLE